MPRRVDEREQARSRAKLRARRALFVDMLKSYAAPLILAAFINPLLAGGAGQPMGAPN